MLSARKEEQLMKQIPLASVGVSATDEQEQRASETAVLLHLLCCYRASLVKQPDWG